MAKKKKGFIFDFYDQMANAPTIHHQLIGDYEAKHKRNLAVYIAQFRHPAGTIMPEDAEILENILRSAELGKNDKKLDLILHSPGGSPEAASNLINVCRSYSKEFRVIVPGAAMSAGTLIAMGADEIVMSDTSKLGPIDPQMILREDKKEIMRPALSFILAYNELIGTAMKLVADKKPATPILHLLNRQDPSWIIECGRARKATKNLAKELLKKYMLEDKDDDFIDKAVTYFFDVGDNNTHGRAINCEEAKQYLRIQKEKKESSLWNLIWEIYTRTEHFAREKGLAKYILVKVGGMKVQAKSSPI